MQKQLFKRSSKMHTVLLMAKYFKRPISFYDLKNMNPNLFNHKSHVDRSMISLTSHGLMQKVSKDTWKITPSGVEYIYNFSKGSYDD